MSEHKDLTVPELGESMTEAVIGKWLVQVGDYVEEDQPVVDLETDKVTVQLPAPTSGTLNDQAFAEGATVRVGEVVGHIVPGGAPSGASETKAKATAAKSETKPEVKKTAKAAKKSPAKKPAQAPTTPAAKSVQARKLSPSERRAVRDGAVVAQPVSAPKAAAPLSVAPPRDDEEVVPMTPLRKRIAERLVQAQQSSASLTTFNEVDMSAVMDLRKQYKDDFLEAHGVKLGFMSFFVKACVAGLKLFPGTNAEVRGESILYKQHYDIGVAVGTEKGLVVPVLTNADNRTFAEIEQGIIDLAMKARANKLVLSDLMGGTFTITNGGIYGSMMSTPLLNFPQTGILGMHNIVNRAMVINGQVEVRPMMYLALTYDHRVVDGKEAVQFLVAVKDRIEHPEKLLFSL